MAYDGPPAAATLAAARGALSEWRLVANEVRSLSASTGAMSGTVGNALVANESQGMSGYVSKLQACRKNNTYFKLEKPRFLFLKGSGAPPPCL
jgi:hypothetical protein